MNLVRLPASDAVTEGKLALFSMAQIPKPQSKAIYEAWVKSAI